MHRYTAHTLQKKTTLGEQSETSRAMIRSFADALIQNAASFIVAVLTLIPPNWQYMRRIKGLNRKFSNLTKLHVKKHTTEDGDTGAAAKLFAGDTPEQKHAGESGTPTPAEKKPDDPFVVRKTVQPVSQPAEVKKIDFSSFKETTQDEIIEAEPAERSIVNAGPGTGKTWTLIEKSSI